MVYCGSWCFLGVICNFFSSWCFLVSIGGFWWFLVNIDWVLRFPLRFLLAHGYFCWFSGFSLILNGSWWFVLLFFFRVE